MTQDFRDLDPFSLTSRFLFARPDLVGPWIFGAYGLLQFFKKKYRPIIITFFETNEKEFFKAVRHHWEIANPDQRITYTFGTIFRNKKGDQRLVIDLIPQKSGKPAYKYVDDKKGTGGICNDASMISWMEK